ncbi:MAG: hypothetical protein GWN07_30330, partial [Actinobacteria bacterium]|nr:hypothetical protein [Actinomycetota bacterium]NIX23884.1 hypothetical protein [Actinomycetota bacterium]
MPPLDLDGEQPREGVARELMDQQHVALHLTEVLPHTDQDLVPTIAIE